MLSIHGKQSNETMSLGDAIGRLIEDSFFLPDAFVSYWRGTGIVPLDVYEDGNNLVIKAALPGIKPEDLNIEVRDNVLTISGETKENVEQKGKGYLLNERRSGQFKRTVTLPYDVDADKAEAEYEDGVLTLTLPKAEAAEGKKISLKPKVEAAK